ncbi:MAG TPA: thiamine pyrophosphate-binding protein [Burkholderiales bacterium]|nr:thiamine pyrophosphate-binding protein [Burkholderiales bacterium]
MAKTRGADLVARTLAQAGAKQIFSLSGNHIMPLYDAALDAELAITHVRHENAAVHMADAWGRLTEAPGIVWLTGGPGHANGIGALYTALESESPLVLISGHAPLSELGRGSFQEMAQADMAAPVAKASWTAQKAESLGEDVARALRIAMSGRPGPVHLSLPFDLLEANVESHTVPADAFRPRPRALPETAADAVIELLERAQRPLVLAGAVMASTRSRELRKRLEDALGVPIVCMESPRGLNDPAQGALAEMVSRADAIVLLGKKPDFTVKFGKPPAISPMCRVAVIDPEQSVLERAKTILGAQRVMLAELADSVAAAEQLIGRAHPRNPLTWLREVGAALRVRPFDPAASASRSDSAVHPVDVGRAVQALIDASPEPLLVSDGGEFGQWAQACVSAPTRVINGQAGSIGSAIPFALAAKVARPSSTVIAMSGDGACGFHLLEMETAMRAGLAFVVVVGNDACWNAEHQIQLRAYGRERAHGCELQPTRYDQVVTALGGHGELVTRAADLPAALSRAVASGKPALVNVMIERLPAPTVPAKPS